MKRKTARVHTEFSKPAASCILTARRKGMNLDEWDYMDAYKVPFDMAFTQKEIRGWLKDFRDCHHLTSAKIVSAEIIELDSTNMSHAGAYYLVYLDVPADEAKEAGLV